MTDLVPVEGRQLWEPLEGESIKAFAAFAVYRDLGPLRSLVKAGQALGAAGGPSNSTQIERWSSKYHWVARCEAYALYLDRRDREATEDEVARMKRRHAQLGQLMSGAAMERLVGREPGIRPDGRIVERVDPLNPGSFDAMDTARLATAGIEAERLSRGLPTTLTAAMNTLTKAEAQRLWSQLIEIALRYAPPDRHEALLRDVQAIGEHRGS